MEFPRLDDTKYPNLGNIDVYSYHNDFDYTRWTPNTKINLVNVRWNGDYSDVVKFGDDDERDEFFNNLFDDSNCSCILNTNIRIDKQTVKVPIPFDVACRYNYLVVDIPIATSVDNKLNYETGDGFRRWHFFIQDWQNTAPSTTVLTIALDVWTQYINSVGFNYMMLERGHAPVSVTDTDSYLANPMENCDYLLTPDVSAESETITHGGTFIPFGNGDKYICFASTCPVSELTKLGTIQTNLSGFTDPTFSDASNYPDATNRWGYQYNVNGFSWGTTKGYSGTSTPAGNSVTTDGRIPNNTTVYAIRSSEASQFFTDILNTQPTFLKTILGCFMVDTSLVTVKNTYTVGGHTVYVLAGTKNDMGSFTLNKDMFNYPEEYERFAKLYTYPYAELEITDNTGKEVRVRIESTGEIRAQAITSVAFPYLNMRMFLTGIAGVGSNTYKWTDLTGVHDEEISNSDWYRFCYDFDIPMYALYMDGQTSWNISNYTRSITNGRNSAIVNYHNSVRQANNVNAGSHAESNTAETNAHNSANTNAANLKRTANTAETNTNNDANTLSSNQANVRSMNSQITSNNNATQAANTARANVRNTEIANQNNSTTSTNATHANAATTQTTIAENESTTSIANAQQEAGIGLAAASLTGAVASVLVPGMQGAAAGMAMSGLANLAQAGTAKGTAAATIQANSTTSGVVTGNTTANALTTQTGNSNNNVYANNCNTDQTNNTINNNTSNTNATNSCNSSNTANTTSNMRTNAANSRATVHTNASAQNATANDNATRTKNTSQENSIYTRNAAIAAAQDILRNTQNEMSSLVKDSANMNPVELCAASGDMTQEFMHNRGIQIKVRTQSKNAIRIAGDEFVRYGYALNQIWNVEKTGLCLMKYFTYWKASDCWIYDKCETNDTAQNALTALFNRGVTVWSNPLEIGRVNPYDN